MNNANDDRVLTLRGQVLSFYLKQVAQELIRRLDGAEEVNNHLEVVAPPCTP
ncbi:MAG: BON domain-containing protein [Actinobacteria bacterium]|nr:BON domain-containing protein [Actinomycetota bacterium]